MTFGELIEAATWPEVKAALRWLFPDVKDHLAEYRQVFWALRAMSPVPDSMRIAIEARVVPGLDDDPVPEVVGRNGTINRELADCSLSEADTEYGRRETVYSLSLQPWRKWLGMSIEPETLKTYLPAQIIAFLLSDMTFHGFTEAENREVLEELRRRVAEIDAMTEEERKEKLIPHEQVVARLKAKFGVEDSDAGA